MNHRWGVVPNKNSGSDARCSNTVILERLDIPKTFESRMTTTLENGVDIVQYFIILIVSI